MTPHLEPTYLRYIYDGLIKGSIHPENAAELPDGLIGMYEEAFDERTSVTERQKLLQRFAIWALLKKEVSAAFVAEILGESEDDIQEFISNYSAWFNSPESGKYQLYHERLKVYLLQKMSEGEVHALHEKLITRLERAIEEQKVDEFEWYGLEFLTSHLAVTAMLNGDGKKLIYLAYSQKHWQRQLKISKGYFWTNNGLTQVMTWASKYNDNEVIECGLQMIDLHHQEQNAAPQIVALVAEGEFDAALKRIEQFGGSDKEGLQRKFILYMLCLMELSLNGNSNDSLKKQGIEKLLSHLTEHLPVDHSILNVAEFYPLISLFQLATEWENIGIDFSNLKNYYNRFLGKWILNKKTLQKKEVNVIFKLLDSLEFTDDDIVNGFSKLLIENDFIKEYFVFRSKISNERKQIYNSIFVIEAFNTIGNFDIIKELINEIEIFQNQQKDILLISIVNLRLKIQLMKIERLKIDNHLIFQLLQIIKNAKPELKSSINIKRGYAILISNFLSEFYFYVDKKTRSYLIKEMNMSFIFSQLLIELTAKTNDLSKLNNLYLDSEQIENSEYFIQVQSIISGKFKLLNELKSSKKINNKLFSILEKEKDGLSKNRTLVKFIKELSYQGEFLLANKLLNKITAFFEVSNAKINLAIGKLLCENESTFIQFLKEIDDQTSKFITIKEAYENYNLDLKTAFFESLKTDYQTNVNEQIKTEFISNLIDFEIDSQKIEIVIKLLSKFDGAKVKENTIRKIVDLLEVDKLHLHFKNQTSNFTIGIYQLNDVVFAEKAISDLLKGNIKGASHILSIIEDSDLKIKYSIKFAELLFKQGKHRQSKKLITEVETSFLSNAKSVKIESNRLLFVNYWLAINDTKRAVFHAEQINGFFKDLAIISISNYYISKGIKAEAGKAIEQIISIPLKIVENLLLTYGDPESIMNQLSMINLTKLISSQCMGNKKNIISSFYKLAIISARKNKIKAAFSFTQEIERPGIKNECYQEISSILKEKIKSKEIKLLIDEYKDFSIDEKKCIVNSIPMSHYTLVELIKMIKFIHTDVYSLKCCYLHYKLNSLINSDTGSDLNFLSNINTNWAIDIKKSNN
jgi:hypothetical protein